jgi:hypothetical protein
MLPGGVMKQVDYDRILNKCNIYDEAERWSLKSLFKSTGKKQSIESFKKFLEQRFGKPILL